MNPVRPARGAVVAAAVAALVLVPGGIAEARAAGATVTVANMAFGPASVTVGLGESVTWSFQDAISHTTTSNQGFWDSGTRSSGATYAHRFRSAGTYAYHCSIHAMMRGRVAVPVKATGSAGAGWALRWSTTRAKGATTFDVQTRRGTGRWRPLVSSGTVAGQRFDPARAGRYSIRARTVKGAQHSGWSPPVTVTIS
jgi:plastocyanin